MDPLSKRCIVDVQRQMLFIDENLESRDLRSFKFLCVDFLAKSVIEKADRGLHLFLKLDLLFENKLVTMNFIAQCLYHIRRYDILQKAFSFTEDDMRQQIVHKSHIPVYRVLLFDLAENITQEEFENAKFLNIDHIPYSVRNTVIDFIELCLTFEKLNHLSECNVNLLIKICKDIKREDLEEKVSRYIQKYTNFGQHSHQRMNSQSEFGAPDVQPQQPIIKKNTAHQNVRHNPHTHNCPIANGEAHTAGETVVTNTSQKAASQKTEVRAMVVQNREHNYQNAVTHNSGQLTSVTQTENHLLKQHGAEAQPNITGSPHCLPEYKMNAKPRGFCVILNNENFHQNQLDPNSKYMKDRQGSGIDMQNLQDCFAKLHFDVRCYTNLRSDQMKTVMDEYARKPHKDYDCFVCCVLSHGSNNVLYGTDGLTIKLEDLTHGFKSIRCKALAGKPKLFFIQSCMGKEKQQGGDIQKDSASGQYEPAKIPYGSIPSEADFLLGYATVPGFVSYRSVTQGSWYITTLTRVLNQYAYKCDLMSMLVKVNEDVSKATANYENGLYKQVPAPLVTLRKRVFFR